MLAINSNRFNIIIIIKFKLINHCDKLMYYYVIKFLFFCLQAESRSSAAGLGTKTTSFAPGDDYKSYIKRMMKSRYEQAD